MTVAVLVAFLAAHFVKDSSYDWLTDYVDPLVVIVLVMLMLPIPYVIVRDNLWQLLLGAPEAELQGQLGEMLAAEMAGAPEAEYHARAVKVGRFLYLQVYVVLNDNSELAALDHQDALRERVNDRLGAEFPNVTADLIFTRDRKWVGATNPQVGAPELVHERPSR